MKKYFTAKLKPTDLQPLTQSDDANSQWFGKNNASLHVQYILY